MALTSLSQMNYGIEITKFNRYIDFQTTFEGPQFSAALSVGYYSLTSIANEVVRAMTAADAANSFYCTVDRTYLSGSANRITIGCGTSGYLNLLFHSGTHTVNTAASVLGYSITDYTGSIYYQNASSIGTYLRPSLYGYNYVPFELNQEVQGSRSIAVSGIKEAIVFNIMKFGSIEFKFEPKSKIAEWTAFMQWAIQQRPFEFTPEIASPSTYYEVTLDTSSRGSNGMGFRFSEQLPQFPNYYQTGKLEFRQVIT